MLQLTNVTKTYAGYQPVLRAVNLSVAAGEIVCLLGPSGSGKTTLLRAITGLEPIDTGAIYLDGRDLAQTPVHQRNFGLMFQEFALFPHRTVGENIAFGLRMAGQSSAHIRARVAELLALVNLQGYAGRSIVELSGGERQRVALARSLAPSPRLLMLDEPLGSLDRALREELMGELRGILKGVGVAALYVTHDQGEAYAVADRIGVMNQGELMQIATPQRLYRQPANEFVARFLGFHNLLPATVRANASWRVETPVGVFTLSANHPPPAGGAHTLLIRPQAAQRLTTTPPLQAENSVRGQVIALSFRGSHYRVVVAVEGLSENELLIFEIDALAMDSDEEAAGGGLQTLVGRTCYVVLDARQLTLLP
jgi:ABC-type Fe3+/spermidine/putrescine transport system ATPase subunit